MKETGETLEFRTESYLAQNCFKDSSTIPRTNRSDCDRQLHAISEKFNTLKIASEQFKLNQQVFKVGVEFQKQIQSQKIYESSIVDTSIEDLNYQKTLVGYDLKQLELESVKENLNRNSIQLEFQKSETLKLQDFWTEKLNLIESRTSVLKSSILQLESKISNLIEG